jgi:gliding motility-associated-like protein
MPLNLSWPCLLLINIFVCFGHPLSAQVNCTPVFIDEYKGADGGPIEPHATKALADGTFLVVGRAAALGASTYDGYISRFNADGTPLWSFFVGGPGNDDLSGITPLNDGTYLLFGTTSSFGHTEGKGWLVHIDLTGTVLWSGQIGASTVSTDRVKAVQQYSDGDIVGTLNVNDSSSASDAVVFKLGLDGTLRWASRFDNGGDDSFTSLAISGDTVYTAGYATFGGTTLGILAELQAETGVHLVSTNITYGTTPVKAQLTSLQIYNGVVSYGLYGTTGASSGNNGTNGMLLIQTDLAGHTKLATYVQDLGSAALLKAVRTADSGFYVLSTGDGSAGYPTLAKINSYGYASSGLYMQLNNNTASFPALDVTVDNGCVLAGGYFTYLNSLFTVERLIKVTSRGEAGSCDLTTHLIYALHDTYSQASFTWASISAGGLLPQVVSPPLSPEALIAVTTCASSVCLNQTTIPAGCGKTYNIQYGSAGRSLFRDAVTMPDGGKIAVGDLGETEGLVVRFQSNGSIAWSKNYNLPGGDVIFSSQVMSFRRIMTLNDGNLLVIGDNYSAANNYAYRQLVLLKLDPNGNVIWCRFSALGDTEVADAAVTSDNGFVLCFNDDWGSGSATLWAARYDANANLQWKRLVTHGNFSAVYKSITCSQDAVFIASDAYQSTYNEFAVDRLDLATGNLVYSQLFSSGANTTVRVNRVFTIADSAYLFLYQYPNNSPACGNVLFELDPQANIMRALNVGNDQLNINLPSALSYLDGTPPSAAITPDLDFWLVSNIVQGSSSYLAVTRMKSDGTIELAKLHTGINGYIPFGVRSQGKGLFAVGADPGLHTGDPDFYNAFVLKLDSSGQLQTGAAANCVASDRTLAVSPLTTYTKGSYYYAAPTSTDTYPLANSTGNPYNENNDLIAQLFCFQPGNCNNVTLQQKGAACSAKDTLVYYLDNSGNCGAAATWAFDTTFFRPALTTGDSIQLIVQKAGSTSVSARVEGYCSLTNQIKNTNILFSAISGLNLPADTVICSNGPIQLAPTPGYTSYLWNDHSTGSNLTVSSPGVYTVTATDQCDHSVNASITVTDANTAFHVTPDTTKCNNDTDTLRATAGYTNYQWSPVGGVVNQGNSALVSQPVTTTYTVTAERAAGCTVTASTLVTSLSSTAIVLQNDTSICSGDSILLDGGAGFSGYQWSTGAKTEQIYVSASASYALTATYMNGCLSKDTFTLESVYAPKPSLDKNPVYCVGSDRTLDAGGTFSSYLWNNDSTGPSEVVFGTGTYWVRVTDQHGCLGSDTVHILTGAQAPKDFLPLDTTVCQYGGLKLTTRSPYDSYTWSDLSNASTLLINQPGMYWLTVTDANGCMATDTISIMQKTCLVGLFVPNAFTPDGNGHNDLFRPLLYGNLNLLDFTVFDRWGQRVFETKTLMDGWDGRTKGAPAPTGIYVWYCTYQVAGAAANTEKGTVVLIR